MTEPIALPSIYKSIAAPAGANPDDVQSTRDQMAMTYAPQESSITSTINTINQYLNRDVSAQQQFGQVADQKISEIGNQLAQKLQGNVGAIGGIFDQGVSKVGGAYDEAAQTLQGVGSSVQNRLAQGAAALGQTQALKVDPYGTDPLSRLQSSLATMQGRNATAKAGSVANLSTLGTTLKGIAQKVVGDSEQEYGQKRVNIQNQVLKTIGQLQTTANTGIMEQLRKFSTLAETAGPAFRTMLNQATTSRNAATRQAGLDAFDQAIKMANLGVSQQNASTRAATAAQSNDPNSLDNIIKGQTIDKNTRDLGRGTYKDDAQGNTDLMDFVNDLRVNKGALNGTQYAGILNFINSSAADAGALNQNPYTYLVQQAQALSKGGNVDLSKFKTSGSKHGDSGYQVPLNTLLEALKLRYGNVGTAKQIGALIK
jgi:hypothetical protein